MVLNSRKIGMAPHRKRNAEVDASIEIEATSNPLDESVNWYMVE
jgi:hypothetical protein